MQSSPRSDDSLWRGVRTVEGARLERVYTGNRIVGSNPTLSATLEESWDVPGCNDWNVRYKREVREAEWTPGRRDVNPARPGREQR